MRSLFILLGFATLFAQGVQAQDKIRAASIYRLETPVGQALKVFAETFKSCTKDSIEVDVSAGLENSQQLAMKVQNGIIDVAIMPASALQSFSNAAGILSAPFVFNNRRHWNAALSSSVVAAMDNQLADSVGLHVLGYMGGEQYGILSTSPIATPKDIEGRKIRTVGFDVATDVDTFGALGAEPVHMSFAEAITKLQTGDIDAAEATAGFVVRLEAFEADAEFTTTNHRIFTDLIVTGSSSIDALTDPARVCLSEAVEKASKVGREAVVSLEQASLAEFTELGIEVRRIDNRPTWFEEASEVTSTIVKKRGEKELYRLILSYATCPAWCDDKKCDDNECKVCKVCE